MTLCHNCNKYDKCFYIKYNINNVDIDDFDKIFNDYIITHNKKFDFYYIDCEFQIQFHNEYTTDIEIKYHYNTDYINIKSYLLFYIDSCELAIYKFYGINHMIINTISCRCNMSYKYYLTNQMSMLERRINYIFTKNPSLINSLNCNKNHPLIRKYPYINEYD